MKTGRTHHLLSLLETRCFHLLDWSELVIDIREQFPLLPLAETAAGASAAGVGHPRVPGTAYWPVMTTDFVVTLSNGTEERDFALSCKPEAELNNPRVLEKLEIERRYWAHRGVRWQVITERDLPEGLVSNAAWVRPMFDANMLQLGDRTRVEELCLALASELMARRSEALSAVCSSFDDRLALRVGSGLALARHALATWSWSADPMIRWTPSDPLPGLAMRTRREAARFACAGTGILPIPAFGTTE